MASELSWRIGDVRVTRVQEQEALLAPENLIHVLDPARLAEHRRWLTPNFMTEAGEIRLSIHALVVESAGRTIVVDTCMGNDRPLPLGLGPLQTNFLEQLERVVKRDQVDLVLCTHLHFDHVGWNTKLENGKWVPTFANARYLWNRAEYEHWSKTEQSEYGSVIQESVLPVYEAGKVDLVTPDHVVTNEVRLEPTHGHTPGHVSVHIHSRGEEAVITGDLMHHPAQCAHPEWRSSADSDGAQAEQTRRDFLARYADRPVLVIGTHFATPTAGKIVKDGGTYRFAV